MCQAEKLLWVAVVEKALEDALNMGNSKTVVNDRRDALEYIESDDRRMCSFVWCCEMLGISVEAVREWLRRKLELGMESV
jgi:hypothetical protein